MLKKVMEKVIEELGKFRHLIESDISSMSIETIIFKLIDVLFAPKQIAMQLAVIAALQVAVMGWHASGKMISNTFMLLTTKGRKIKQIQNQMENCPDYKTWQSLAEELDVLRGLDKWRAIDESPLFDARVLRKRIKETQEMLRRGDLFDLIFRLRGGLARDQYGTQHEGLYSRAAAGTKKIIEQYHETMSTALNYVCDSGDSEVPDDAKLAFFNETRHAYGRTALLLSGGAYLGYYHMGVCKALYFEGLFPRVISGASAGSLITAIIGTKNDRELEELFSEGGFYGDGVRFRQDFFKSSNKLRSPMASRIQQLVPLFLRRFVDPILGFMFDGKILNMDMQHLTEVVVGNVGFWTFQESFDRTGRIINITVAPLNNYDPPRLLNYLTAPHICVWSAAVASCAIPGVFESCHLIVKEPNGNFRRENEWTRHGTGEKEDAKTALGQGYSDGSIESDLPMQQLSELFNVNHFIVSQVNPHSALLSSLSLRGVTGITPLMRMVVGYTR